MIKRTPIVLALLVFLLLPASAFGAEPQSVSDHCQQVSQAQTSEAMVQEINAAFEALKVEASADQARMSETTPTMIDVSDEEEEEDEEEDSQLPLCTITRDGKTMNYYLSVKGEPGETGYPLYITLHGGGEGSKPTNDAQWNIMYDYYRRTVDNGIYVACRGMEDVWNMHSLTEAYAMYDRIIEDMVLLKNADPNRVYLLGFSAGGDGVYEITPRMADRFAAANMSSGHPNNVSLLNVANVPFEIQVGVRDYLSEDARRSVRGAEFEKILSGHHDTYGFGYEHRVLVHVPDGHILNDCSAGNDPNATVLTNPTEFADRAVPENWLKAFVDIYKKYYPLPPEFSDADEEEMFDILVSRLSYESDPDQLGTKEQEIYDDFCAELEQKITGEGESEYGLTTELVDADAVHYVNQFTRNASPKQLVWDLATRASERSVSSFYWLKADKSQNAGLITASFDAATNTFKLNPSNVAGDFSVLINPHMVDVSRPVTFETPKGTFTVNVTADAKVTEASLLEVTDPYLAWVQEVSYQQLGSSEPEPDPKPEPTPVTPKYVGSGGGTWTKGTNKALSFAFTRNPDKAKTYEHFVGVRVDGTEISSDAYEVTTAGTIRLKPAYLEKLSTGGHKLTAVFDDGEATISFTVRAAQPSPTKKTPTKATPKALPKTGDANKAPIALMAGFGCAALALSALLRRRQQDC